MAIGKTPEFSTRDFSKILRKNGYSLKSQKGDHFKYENEDGRTIVINFHLNKMVARRLIKENCLTI